MPYLNKLLTLTVLSLTFFSFSAAQTTDAVSERVQSRFVESIAYGTKGDKGVAKFFLTDGSTWDAFYDFDQEHLFVEVEKVFLGREAYLRGSYNTSKFDLITENDQGQKYIVPVSLTKGTRAQLPKLVKKEKFLVEPAGWFSDAKYSYTLSFSDGTTWDLDSSNSFMHACLLPSDRVWTLDEAGLKKLAMDAVDSWKEGDCFLFSKCPFQKDSFFMVNIDFKHHDYRSVFYCDGAKV